MRQRLPWPLVIAGGAAPSTVACRLGRGPQLGRVPALRLSRAVWRAIHPLYGKDIGFYLFSLPAYVVIKNWMLLTSSCSVRSRRSGLLGARRHRIQRAAPVDVTAAIAHGSGRCSALLRREGLVLMISTAFCCSTVDNGVVVGASYTDIHIALPILWLPIGLPIIAALAAWANLGSAPTSFRWPRRCWSLAAPWCWPGGPRLFQRVFVKPNELQLEKPYIQRNIDLDPAGLQSPSDLGQTLPGRTERHLPDARGQQGDHRQHSAVGLAAADGYLRSTAGDSDLLQVP